MTVKIVIPNGQRLPINPSDPVKDATALKPGDPISYVLGIDSYRPRARREWGLVHSISNQRVVITVPGRAATRHLKRGIWKNYSVARYLDMP